MTATGRWPEGQDVVSDMIGSGVLDHGVFANPAEVAALFDDAETHLVSAAQLKDTDPRAAYSVMYSGVRKSLVAALLVQGLRARGGENGHRHVYDVIRAQLGPTASRTVDPMDRMRRKRNAADYDAGAMVEAADVEEDLPKAQAIVTGIRRWSRLLGPF